MLPGMAVDDPPRSPTGLHARLPLKWAVLSLLVLQNSLTTMLVQRTRSMPPPGGGPIYLGGVAVLVSEVLKLQRLPEHEDILDKLVVWEEGMAPVVFISQTLNRAETFSITGTILFKVFFDNALSSLRKNWIKKNRS